MSPSAARDGVLTATNTAKAYAEWARTSLLKLKARPSSLPVDPRGILLLATHLPPSTYGGVYRPLHFLRYAAKRGWNVTAICEQLNVPANDAGRYLESKLPDGVAIHRFPSAEFKPSWRAFPWVDGGFLNSLRMVRTTLTHLRSRPAAVLATAPRFYSFPAAALLADLLGCRLVLDYRDEWTECPFDFVTIGNADHHWEKRCLGRADAVIYTTESIRRHAVARFGEFLDRKSHVVPNGWDEVDFAKSDSPPSLALPPDKVTLSFLGSFNNSSPDSFLGTLNLLLRTKPHLRDRISVHFIGPMEPDQQRRCKAMDPNGILNLHPPVPKNEATAVMKQSSALLSFIGADLARYMPQKIYEYAASGRPILLYGHEGEASSAVIRNELGRFVKENDAVDLGKAIEDLDESDDVQESPRHSTWIQEHRREILVTHLLDIIDRTVPTLTRPL
jgi:glycosyltransferase involved in cell wall biosynthesis